MTRPLHREPWYREAQGSLEAPLEVLERRIREGDLEAIIPWITQAARVGRDLFDLWEKIHPGWVVYQGSTHDKMRRDVWGWRYEYSSHPQYGGRVLGRDPEFIQAYEEFKEWTKQVTVAFIQMMDTGKWMIGKKPHPYPERPLTSLPESEWRDLAADWHPSVKNPQRIPILWAKIEEAFPKQIEAYEKLKELVREYEQ